MRAISIRDPRTLELFTAGVAGALALLEIILLIVDAGAAKGQTMLGSVGSGLIAIVLLGACAVGFVRQRGFGWVVGVFAFLAALNLGIVTRASGNPIGIVFIFGALVLMGLTFKTLGSYQTRTLAEV